jgi:hypothetical protein
VVFDCDDLAGKAGKEGLRRGNGAGSTAQGTANGTPNAGRDYLKSNSVAMFTEFSND